jgi:AhpD family alkylhydroperoxidase
MSTDRAVHGSAKPFYGYRASTVMTEMREAVEDFQEAMQLLGKNNPEVMRDFRRFMDSVLKEGYLDVKTKELIALGMAITARCRYCIGIHVEKCISAGAKKEEILEAATVAILMGGGPALTYIAEVKKALEEFA